MFFDEVPKHIKKGGKKLLSATSTKHLWDKALFIKKSLVKDAERLVTRGLPNATWTDTPRSSDWRWFNEFWHDGLEKNCEELERLITEIDKRTNAH